MLQKRHSCVAYECARKHLIVAIGTECYVTLPKGQIIPTQSAADKVVVPGGGNVLIVPITHYPTYTTIPPDLAEPIFDETTKWVHSRPRSALVANVKTFYRLKAALRAMYAKHGSSIVFFEVGRISGKGGHAHVQAVPIPMKLIDKVEETFVSQGRMQGIDFEDDAGAALDACAGGRGGYFKVDLPDGKTLVHLMKDHVPFSINFGR